MSIKLGVRLKKGEFSVVGKDMPDIEEAKKFWMQGKSAQWILENHRKRAKHGEDEEE